MKKILNALFATLLAVFTFSSCSDVPAPYEIMDEGDLPDIGLEGKGTQEDPYSVEYVIAKGAQGGEGWVQGYIVGGVKENTPNNWIETADDAVIGEAHPTGVRGGVVLLATDPDETDYKKCITAKLYNDGASEAVEAALSIPDNTDKALPRLVKVKGTLVKNTWGLPGLKGVKAAVLEDGTLVGEGGEETPSGNILFKESFAENQGNFTIKDVVLPDGATAIWKYDKYEDNPGYMTASGQINDESKASESWLISPEVDLSTATKATLTFDHAHKFAGDKKASFFTLWITEAAQEDWKQLTIPNYSDEKNWTFYSSGNIDLSAYAGKKIKFAFKYVSEDGASGKWEVNNVKIVGDGEAGTEPTPGDEVVVTKEQPYEESFMDGEGKFTIDNKNLGTLNFVWKHGVFNDVGYMKASAFANNQNNEAESWLLSPVINLTGLTKAELTFDQAVNHRKGANAADHLTLVATVQGQDNWQPIALTYPENDGYDYVTTTADLSQYAGQKMQLAFKYVSTTAVAPTWQIQNVKVSAGEGGTEPEPEPSGDYTSNIELPASDFVDSDAAAYGGNIVIDGTEYPIVKLGASKKAGFWNSSVLKAGATELSLYALGWSGKTGGLTITIENGGSFEGGATSQTIELDGKTEGITGNPPFKDVTPAATDYHSYKLEGITASSTIKLTSGESGSDKRAVIFGVNVK